MKKWNEAEIVELNIAETAGGNKDWYTESSNILDTNNDLMSGQDSDGDGFNTGETITGSIFGVVNKNS